MQTRVQVFTFRDGLLARLAHDLQITVGRFELALDHGRVHGWFDPTSLQVDGAVRDQRLQPAALSADDKRKIHENLTREVLETARYPRIEVEGRLEAITHGYLVAGQLHMHGQSRALSVPVRFDAEGAVAEVELTPSLFGIAPYKALGGAIRLQDRVVVRLTVLAAKETLEAAAASPEPTVFGLG